MTPTTTEGLRVLGLAGTYNLRDVGGYPTQNGSRTRWRTLLRSDSLHRLATGEQATLLELGLRTVIDLRSERELAEAPNVFAASDNVRYLNLPLVPGGGDVRAEIPSLEVLYRLIVNTRSAELAAIVNTLAVPGALPAVVHCTAGKDRTGLVIALLLRLVGVDAETIAADYNATEACLAGEFMVDFRQRTEARGIDWQAYEPLLKCPPEFMLSLLTYVDETHGGVHAYLMQAGVAAEQLAVCKRRWWNEKNCHPEGSFATRRISPVRASR
jgi:protein-tyrosine phosphatase